MFTRFHRVWLFGLMMLPVSAGLAFAQGEKESSEARLWTNQALWLAGYNKDVQGELGLTPEQSNLAAMAHGAMGRFGALEREKLADAPMEEQRRRFQESRDAASKAAQPYVERFVSSLLAEQLERLNQLSLQMLGDDALQLPAVVSALSLSDDQTAKIAAARTESSKKRRELMSASNTSLGQAEQLKQARQERLADIIQELNLNSEQEAKLSAILQRSDARAMQILGLTKMPTREGLAVMERESFDQMLQVLTNAQRQQFDKLRGKKVGYRLRW